MSLTITRPAIPVPLPIARGGTEGTTPAEARTKLELGDLALLTAPGGTTTFLRADKTWAAPPGSGGSSDFLGLSDTPDSYTGQAGKYLAVNPGATALEFLDPPTSDQVGEGFWDWTTSTSGAPNTGHIGIDNATPASATQLRIHEQTTHALDMTNALTLLQADDIVSIQDRNDGTKWLRYTITAAGTDQGLYWTFPVTYKAGPGGIGNNQECAVLLSFGAGSGSGLTLEQVQDAVAAMFPTSASLDFTYNDAAGTIAAEVRFGGVTENHLSFSDVTSDNASTGQHGLLPKLSGTTTTFLRGDGTWATPAGGGDVSSNTGTSVDSEVVLFSATTGKLVKRATGSGLALLTNGVLSIKASPTGAVVGTTDTQTLTGKTISGATNTLTVREADLALTDLTTANVSTTAHGLTPKAPGGTTQFLRGDATWAVPPTGTSYTDEQAQDAVGAMLGDTATIDFTYTDATPSLTADVKDASLTEAKLSLSDVATLNASTTQHGFLRKLSGVATQYQDGTGNWSTPAGGAQYWGRSTLGTSTLTEGLLAFWKLEEASGNRVDSIGSLALVPGGTTATLTNGTGKTGQALYHGGGTGYLRLDDHATMSIGANTSFTIGCWVYFAALGGSDIGILGKGSSDANMEYLLERRVNTDRIAFVVGNGSSAIRLDWSAAPSINTWYFVLAWYDHVADVQYLQVNNGTPVSVANTAGSLDNAHPFEVGRYPQYSGNWFNGRIDNIMLYKRVLTAQERTDWYNSGTGLDYPPPAGAGVGMLTPATATDMLVLGASATTPTGTADGTLRWTGSDFEGRKGGGWVSLTGPPATVTTETRVETLAVLNRQQDGTVTTNGSWQAEMQTSNLFWWRVPAAYAGGNATLTILRRATATGGTALMTLQAFRLRENAAPSAAILSQTINLTPSDTLTHALTATLLAADLTIGDLIRIELARDGANAGDTANIIGYDGASVTYTATLALTGGGSGTPGGSAGQAQWNNAGAFGGSSGLTLSATQVTSLVLAAPLAITQGGTGAGDAATARTNFGLQIGVDVQAQDAELSALAGLVSAADQAPYFTGSGTAALTPLTPFARTLLDDPDAATMRTTLGVPAASAVQPLDATLTALAALATGANQLAYSTGTDTFAQTPLTVAGRALLDDADNAAQRMTLGLGTLAQQDANNVNITDGRISLGGHSSTGVLDVQGSVPSEGSTTYNCARLWPVAPSGSVYVTPIEITSTTGANVAAANFNGLAINDQPTMNSVNALYLAVGAGANRYNVYAAGGAPNYFAGNVGLGATPVANRLHISFTPGVHAAISTQQTADSGTPLVMYITNAAGTGIGSITTTATATAFNTSSDRRLKRSVQPLTNALATLRQLRIVRGFWNYDDTTFVGVIADEAQKVIPEMITGEPDALDAQGQILPQGADYAKLTPWLTAAVQELATRLDALEAALGG